VWKFNEDYALDASLAGEWMLYRQFDPQTEQFTVKFQMTVLFPHFEL
jgi:hypothetical protein